jgi:cobalt-zinc-cadmium efflux system protein
MMPMQSQDHKHEHAHSAGHHNDHDHHHHGPGGHSHLKASDNIAIAFALNLSFAVVEAVGGWLTGSVAIMTDALHDLGDSLALGFAFVMERIAGRKGSARFSYGYRRLSLLSAVVTAGVLIAGSAAMLAYSVQRLFEPVQPHTGGMFALALLGIAVNGYAAFRLQKGTTLNEKMVSWHMLEDLLGWVVILISSVVMMFVDIPILDPVLSILLVFVIIFGTIRSLKETLNIFLQGTPRSFDLEALKSEVSSVAGVRSIHDVHFWSLDGSNHVLTSHVVVDPGTSPDAMELIKQTIRDVVQRRGKIHVTLEIELDGGECPSIDCVT